MKVLTIIIAVMMVFTLCSCSNDTPAKEDLVSLDTVTEPEPTSDENNMESDGSSEELTKVEDLHVDDITESEEIIIADDEIIIQKPDVSVSAPKDDITPPSTPDTPETPNIDSNVDSESKKDDTEVKPDIDTTPETTPEQDSEQGPDIATEVIDTAVLEAYGRSYAASAYGYWGNPSTGFSSNAGYFPPTYVIINTMDDGYRYAREVVDAQYYDDIAAGQPITAEIDGVTVRRKINIYFQKTDDPNLFLLYCFYGGE